MSDIYTNETGCVLTRSHISGDILCRWPGEGCDCLMQKIDEAYAGTTAAQLDADRASGDDWHCEECRQPIDYGQEVWVHVFDYKAPFHVECAPNQY